MVLSTVCLICFSVRPQSPFAQRHGRWGLR